MNDAIGLIETKGSWPRSKTADAMLKAANITLVDPDSDRQTYVTTVVRGDVSSVRAAVDAGAGRKQVGDLVSGPCDRPSEGSARSFFKK